MWNSVASDSQCVSLELAVFDARLYIRVRRIDEPAQLCGVWGRSRSQLHMAHELAGALQQAGRIRQRCAVKEPHIDVRSEYIDVPEGRISQTCDRTAVMQKLPDFVPAFSHHLKPLMRDGSQSTRMRFHPRIDGWIPLDSAVESQQFRSHRRCTFCFRDLKLSDFAGKKIVVLVFYPLDWSPTCTNEHVCFVNDMKGREP
jgi:Redoxin